MKISLTWPLIFIFFINGCSGTVETDLDSNNTEFLPLEINKTWVYETIRSSNEGFYEEGIGSWKVTDLNSSDDSIFFSVENINGPRFSEIGREFLVVGDTIYAEVLTWNPDVTVFNRHLIPPEKSDTSQYYVAYSYDFGINMRVYQEKEPYFWDGNEYEPAWVFLRSIPLGSDTLRFVRGLGITYQYTQGMVFGDGESYEVVTVKKLKEITF